MPANNLLAVGHHVVVPKEASRPGWRIAKSSHRQRNFTLPQVDFAASPLPGSNHHPARVLFVREGDEEGEHAPERRMRERIKKEEGCREYCSLKSWFM